MSFKVSEVSKEFNLNEFVSLCQDVMTGNVVMEQQTFFQKVSKTLFTDTDPITKHILTENIKGLYVFLTEMSAHPMRVPLSHALPKTFLSMVRVNSNDISKLLAKYNTEYSLELDGWKIRKNMKSSGCPYDKYFEHILKNGYRTKGVGRVKVVLIYSDSVRENGLKQGAEFKLNVPFKTVSKKIYVDIRGKKTIPKEGRTLAFIKVNDDFKTCSIPNSSFFNTDTPIGDAIAEYYKIWKVKERFLKKTFSAFLGGVKWMYFTSRPL